MDEPSGSYAKHYSMLTQAMWAKDPSLEVIASGRWSVYIDMQLGYYYLWCKVAGTYGSSVSKAQHHTHGDAFQADELRCAVRCAVCCGVRCGVACCAMVRMHVSQGATEVLFAV